MYANPFILFQEKQDKFLPYYFSEGSNMIEHVGGRNNYKMPAYHRLDVGVNLHKEKPKYNRTWSLGLYNAYNRQNAFMIFADYDWNVWNYSSSRKKIQQFSLFPVIPYFRWSVSF